MSAPGWEDAWRSPNDRLVVQRQVGSEVVRHRFISNEPGDGAVVVVCRGDRLLFIAIDRPVVGERLWEMVRGQAEPEDGGAVATATRELLEETGLVMTDGEVIGRVWTDSGLSGDHVHVVLATEVLAEPAADVIPEVTELHWLDHEEIDGAILDGRIADGLTLSVLTLLRTQKR